VEKMIARSYFRNDTTEMLVLCELRSDLAGKQLRAGTAIAIAQNSNRGFVT